MPTLPENPVDYKPTRVEAIRGFIQNILNPIARGKQKAENQNSEAGQPHILRRATPEEEIMEKRDKTNQRVLGGGINQTYFVEFKDDGSGVFKPKEGEVGVKKNFYKKERAAYLVSRFLGLNLVPPTIIRKIDGKIGSVQQFIPDAENAYLNKDSLNQDQLFALWIFDYIIQNTDRHPGNLLIKEDKIYAIDHGYSMDKDDRGFYSLFKAFYDTPAPKELVGLLNDFLSDKTRPSILKELLSELLSNKEVEACMDRIKWVGQLLAKNNSIKNGELDDFRPSVLAT